MTNHKSTGHAKCRSCAWWTVASTLCIAVIIAVFSGSDCRANIYVTLAGNTLYGGALPVRHGGIPFLHVITVVTTSQSPRYLSPLFVTFVGIVAPVVMHTLRGGGARRRIASIPLLDLDEPQANVRHRRIHSEYILL